MEPSDLSNGPGENIEYFENLEDEDIDLKVKEEEFQDLIKDGFDDFEEEIHSFRNESSISSSRSSWKGDGRFLQDNNGNVSNTNPNLEALTEWQNVDDGIVKEHGSSRNWEGEYYVKADEQSATFSNQCELTSQPSLEITPPGFQYNNGKTAQEYEPYQRNAVTSKGAGGDSNDEARYDQLKILYEARGREIENLRHQLETLNGDWSDETVALKQQLQETEGEMAKYASCLEECQIALGTANERGAAIEGEFNALNIRHEAVEHEKRENWSKLQVAELTIEGLRSHLRELEKCDRNRDNQAAYVSRLQENHRSEITKSNEEINSLRESLSEYVEEVNNLKTKLEQTQRDCENIKIEKGETINRLLKALEESQKKCENLVKSAPSAISNAERESVELLKKELATANKELNQFRIESRLTATKSDENLVGATSVSDNLILSLKAEVERSLSALSSKNDQLKKIQAEYQSALSQTNLLNEKVDQSENEVLKSQNTIKVLTNELNVLKLTSNTSSSAAAKQINQLKNEKTLLECRLQEIEKFNRESLSSEAKLKEAIFKLKQEIMHLVNTKEVEIEECKTACLKLQEDCVSKETERHAANLKQIQKLYEEKTKTLTNELNEVKSLYITVCEEKNNLEKSLRKQWEIEKNKMKESMDEIKNSEIMTIKREYEKRLLKNPIGVDAKNELISKEVSKQLNERIQYAKKLWKSEQSNQLEEKAAIRANEMFQEYLNGKNLDNSEVVIDGYLDNIKELEKRVKETEELYRKHLSDMESNKEKQKIRQLKELEERLKRQHETILRDAISVLKVKYEAEKQALKVELHSRDQGEGFKELLQSADKQLKDTTVVLENQREQLSKEFAQKLDLEKIKIIMETKLEAEKVQQLQLQNLSEAKEGEKNQALKELDEHLCKEFENFLASQKQRYLSSLKSMQDSHTKEKIDIQKNYEDIIARLKMEYKEHHEMRQLDQNRINQNNFNQIELEKKSLLLEIEELKGKCNKLEDERHSLTTKTQGQLQSTKNELEDCKLQMQQFELDLLVRQEEQVIAPIKKDMADLRARANAAEELAARLRLQLEEESLQYKSLNEKYTILKEKVRKYHQYIHSKERQYAENLTKLTLEYKSAVEKLAEAVNIEDMLNKLITKDNSNSSSNKRSRTPDKILNNKAFFSECTKKINEQEKEEMKTHLNSIEKIHGDIKNFLIDCSRDGAMRIEEAKVSWTLSAQLRGDGPRNVPSSTSKQTSVYMTEGSRSGSDTPEPPTNGSSGRGTMIGNSAGSASEGVAELYRTYAQLSTDKAYKICSSTPYEKDNAHLVNIAETPVVNTGSYEHKFNDEIDEWPVSHKTDTTKTIQEEAEHSDHARLAKLKSLMGRIVHVKDDRQSKETQCFEVIK